MKIWRQFWDSKSIYEILMPFYKISKILAIAPFRCKYEDGSYRYKTSKKGTAYSLLILMAYSVLFIYVSQKHYNVNFPIMNTEGTVIPVIDKFQWYSTIIVLICLILAQNYKQDLMTQAVNEMAFIDKEIESHGITINYHSSKMNVAGVLLAQTLIYLIMEEANCSLFLVTMRIPDRICHALCYLPLLIFDFTKSQYSILVMCLRDRFQALNQKLNTKAELLDYFEIYFLEVLDPKASESLASIRKLHGKLCRIGRLINSAYSIQTLIIIGYNFVNFTTHAYFIIETLIKIYIAEGTVNFALIATIIWTGLKLATLFHITFICTVTKEEANATGVIIHKIKNRNQSALTTEIIGFSKQILHSNFKFTAFDLFSIDISLFYSMITTATAYLMVLIQIDLAVYLNSRYKRI